MRHDHGYPRPGRGHDLADRIVVMNERRIEQVGPPMEIYSRPANVFVAQFVGSPAMNLAPSSLVDGKSEYSRA